MFLPESLDLDVDAGRQVQLHERVHRLRRGLEEVQQPLVRADLELLAALLVHVRRAQHGPAVLHRGERDRAGHPRTRALGGVHDLGGRLVQDPVVVSLEPNPDLLCLHICLVPPSAPPPYYSSISVSGPPPTARPPSRTAKRSPFSMAMGVISSTSTCVLSPGITISTPDGSVATPVTSVVRK